jgi:hypothetical protein
MFEGYEYQGRGDQGRGGLGRERHLKTTTLYKYCTASKTSHSSFHATTHIANGLSSLHVEVVKRKGRYCINKTERKHSIVDTLDYAVLSTTDRFMIARPFPLINVNMNEEERGRAMGTSKGEEFYRQGGYLVLHN